MNDELKRIKKIYGEEMMHLCRELFPSILEKEGFLLSILEKNLAPTHSFASDIINNHLYVEFKDWIYSFINVKNRELELAKTDKTPFEIMDEAGYTLYECKTEKDIQSFKKYYRLDECLCTIKRGGRLYVCYVFFAVKKNVDEIRRENFINPERQDEYGTSVISIQFYRGDTNNVSIKNRYNHTVNQPDSTFSNNLDNIIPGLTMSFEKYYGFKINKEIKESEFLTNHLHYVKGDDGKYYRFNCELDGVYFCENNILIKNGKVCNTYAMNKERYLLIENYLIDRKEKCIIDLPYNNTSSTKSLGDPFLNSIKDVGIIKNINLFKNGEKRNIIFSFENNQQVIVVINKNNSIIEYYNEFVKNIDHFFLQYNETLEKIELANVEKIGCYFLTRNEKLSNISLPQVQTIGSSFLPHNQLINKERIFNEIKQNKYGNVKSKILKRKI